MTKVYVEMWAVIFPDGRIVTGTDFTDEEHAWMIALGWPHPDEIEHAKNKEGIFAQKVTLRYYRP